jgi:hypothetical protein
VKVREEEEMDLRQIEQAVKDSKGGITEKKEVVAATLPSPDEDTVKSSIDSGRALQLFLDHVSISSIPDFIVKNPHSGLTFSFIYKWYAEELRERFGSNFIYL